MSRDPKKARASGARYDSKRVRPPGESRKYRQKWQRALRELLTRIKSVPCADCGNTFDPVCMDFDHREPGTKVESVSRLFRHGEKAVLAEIAKCDIVCSNCHRIRTYRLRNHEEWRGAAQKTKAAAPQLKLELLPDDVERQVQAQLDERAA